jgi:uncharacterized protein
VPAGVGDPAAVLSGLFVYPLKSAAGIALSRARIDARGIAGDRRWMVVDRSGVFLTQRTQPRLALVRVRIAGDDVVLSAPGMGELALAPPAAGAPRRVVTVWRDTVPAVPAGATASEWMSEHLGCRCDVVYLPGDVVRPVDPGYGAGRQVSFADAFPFLLLSQGSLDDLNSRLAKPVPMNRFRPNLVVAGCEPYAEDGWGELTIGTLRFAVARPCVRCATTTVDQATGERGREPLATLALYRRAGEGVVLGQNLIHLDRGELALGDPVALAGADPR